MYPSDLKDKEWSMIEVLRERSDPRGARRKHDIRQIVNAIFYRVKTGCQSRMLPQEFPPWQTVYDHIRRLKERGLWEKMLLMLYETQRKKEGDKPAGVF
ncbi:MAG: transposase [Kiritimatiellae bacterium]|nr:transposase [Kiritimatiellia bacterium]